MDVATMDQVLRVKDPLGQQLIDLHLPFPSGLALVGQRCDGAWAIGSSAIFTLPCNIYPVARELPRAIIIQRGSLPKRQVRHRWGFAWR